MKAVELFEINGIDGLRFVDAPCPKPADAQVLIRVKAAGINYAELEILHGRYPVIKELPYIMGFEAAGVIQEVGASVTNVKVGDHVTGIVTSGGYAEFALLECENCIPMPAELSFAEAASIPITGLTAYAMLAGIGADVSRDTIVIQAAAGGVGLCLLQLAPLFGFKKTIALTSSDEKFDILRSFGADFAINYAEEGWEKKVLEATSGRGADVVLQSIAGEAGQSTISLVAPFGQVVLFGAANAHDNLSTGQVSQIIKKNLTVRGFNLPSLPPDQIKSAIPSLLKFVAEKRLRFFAKSEYPIEDFATAFSALKSRQTVGKLVLIP